MTIRTGQFTQAELQEIMEAAVCDAFTRMGIDHDDPIEMQKDFQHLRDWRKTTEAIRKRGLLTVVVVVVTGGCSLLWLGLRGIFQTH